VLPPIFFIVVSVVIVLILLIAIWDIVRTSRRVDRDLEAARQRGFFDDDLETVMARDERMNPSLGSRVRWPR
jgi:FtsZ-interacting cell division protein ZipA